MTTIAEKIRARFPDAPHRSWIVADDGDGPRIVLWDDDLLGPQPTLDEVAGWPEEPRRKVAKDLVEQRLAAVGKLDACMAIIMGNAAFFSRWYARAFPWVYADDPDTIAVLDQVGADPVSILAA